MNGLTDSMLPAIPLELKNISFGLYQYRSNFMRELEASNSAKTELPIQQKLYSAYSALLISNSRHPTYDELRERFNSDNNTSVSRPTIKKYVHSINNSKQPLTVKIKISQPLESRLYTPAFMNCYEKLLNAGRIPSVNEAIEALRTAYPDINVTPKLIRSICHNLQGYGIKIPFRKGELTKNLLMRSFLTLKVRDGFPPSLTEITLHLNNVLGIPCQNSAVSKMLQSVRESLPVNDREEWQARRLIATPYHDIINAHKRTVLNLRGKGLRRAPLLREVYTSLKRKSGGKQIKFKTFFANFKKMNSELSERGKPVLPYKWIKSEYQDAIELTVRKLSKQLAKIPSASEVIESLAAQGRNCVKSSVMEAVYKANKGRKTADRIRIAA